MLPCDLKLLSYSLPFSSPPPIKPLIAGDCLSPIPTSALQFCSSLLNLLLLQSTITLLYLHHDLLLLHQSTSPRDAIMQIHLLLLPLLASLFALLTNAQTPDCSTSSTCFGEGPSHVDIKRGLAVIKVACTELVGKYMVQEQRLTCAWGTSLMKFDFAVRNLDVVPRSVSTDDCINGMTYVLQKNCGNLGGRQRINKIMFLSVRPIPTTRAIMLT